MLHARDRLNQELVNPWISMVNLLCAQQISQTGIVLCIDNADDFFCGGSYTFLYTGESYAGTYILVWDIVYRMNSNEPRVGYFAIKFNQ